MRPGRAGALAVALSLVSAAGGAVAAASQPAAPAVRSVDGLALPSGAVGDTASVRYAGADRYETSAEVSRLSWTPGEASVVHLASGEAPADALSMGASTLGLGPVLLTRRDALPPAVEAELERLAPCMVIVVGGAAAVSDAVAERAAAHARPEACTG